jgi:hypothetical protein
MPRPITSATVKKSKRDMTNVRKRNVSGTRTLSDEMQYWWEQPTDKIGGAIAQVVQRIDDINYEYRDRFMRYARLYGNYEALGWANLSNVNRTDQSNNRPVYNIIQSAIDTINSKIARDNPAPYFITNGADYFDKLKAEKMTNFIQGLFQQMKLYDIANNKVFRDACVYGLGCVQFNLNKQTNKIEAEWVFIDELKIDLYDAQKQQPRSIHRCKMVQKELLISQFPDKEDVINDLTSSHPTYFRSNDTVIDFVVTTESWHLSNNGKQGRHVIILADEVLVDEDYDCDWFPLAFYSFYEKPIGIYGRSITETILSGQIEINKILMFIQQCQELQASPVILVDSSSEVSEDVLLSNQIARMIPYRSGTNPPSFVSPQAASPEIYQHLKDWMTWCYQEAGISQTSAGGTKQPGVNSAVAMRTMVDIESSRFIQCSKNWEQFFVHCAEICVKLGKIAYEKDPSFSVQYVNKKSKILKDLPWSKINLPDDSFVIRCDTISSFPQSAAGRIQTITDFISNNWMSKERGMELLQLDPDLEDEVKLATSSLLLCEKLLCQMVEEGIYEHPEPFINLQLVLGVSQNTYNLLKQQDCPEERLELVRQWIQEIATLLTGQDPTVQLLQQTFQPPQQTPPTPQAGIAPA